MTPMLVPTAKTILGRTSALAACEAISFDVCANQTNVNFYNIKIECSSRIDPVNSFLQSELYSENQIAGATGNIKGHSGKQALVDRNYRALVTREEADEWFRGRYNFGANSIDELFEAIKVVTEAQKQEASFDPVAEIIAHSTEEANQDPPRIRSKDPKPEAPDLTTKDIEGIVTCLEDDNFHRFVDTIEAFIERAKDLNSFAVDPKDKRATLNQLQKAIMGACELM